MAHIPRLSQKGYRCGNGRWFMQLIFAQDKPILENQIPKRLPLAPSPKPPFVLMLLRWLPTLVATTLSTLRCHF